MSIDDTTAKDRNQPTSKRAVSRVATPAVLACCLAIYLLPLATVAEAHVKWFVPCNTSDNPIPLTAALTSTFWLFAALFVTLFYLACRVEETTTGTSLTELLDRVAPFLNERADVLLQAVAAASFWLLWANGSVILTPELKGNGGWVSAMQLVIALFLIARATLPAAGAGIAVLYCLAVDTYGLFHMLDYSVFPGLAAYFALSTSRNARVHAFRFECLRWSIALSLLWPSMEKFLYPAWVAPIVTAHPLLTLGFDVATVITAAGVLEFGLAFALLWTPLVRRLGALALATLILFASTFNLGRLDVMDHLLIIAVLLVVAAEPGKEQPRCRPAISPVVSGTALLAAIFLYSGAHTLYYGTWSAAFVPLASGTALLAIVFLNLHGFAHALARMGARGFSHA